jgi:hypothetical protein
LNNCSLGDFFTFTHSYKCVKHGFDNSDSYNYMVLRYTIPHITDFAGFYCEAPPYRVYLYSEYIAQFNGLRAPPVC